MSPPRQQGKRRNGLLVGPDGLTWAERAEKKRKAKEKAERRARNPALGEVVKVFEPDPAMEERLRLLNLEVQRLKKLALDTAVVREEIFKLAKAKPEPPRWTLEEKKGPKNSPGVPTLFASDWHWGEVVNPQEIGGVNEYNLKIAHRRAKALIANTINMLKHHMVNPNYPGIVFVLGGDMVSGDIHDELSQTNETPIMPAVLDLFGVLITCIRTLADEFGAVFLPCVTGNHGRTTHKMHSKQRVYLNYDWLLYQMLAVHFKEDKRVTFAIPDGPDEFFRVYNHTYFLTHGDRFRGGDGMIGHIGPVTRGRRKALASATKINREFNTMLHGHFHTYSPGDLIIGNGSLIGFNEYANGQGFEYEAPRQALWITHPQRGITFHMAVHVEPLAAKAPMEWVSVRKSA